MLLGVYSPHSSLNPCRIRFEPNAICNFAFLTICISNCFGNCRITSKLQETKSIACVWQNATPFLLSLPSSLNCAKTGRLIWLKFSYLIVWIDSYTASITASPDSGFFGTFLPGKVSLSLYKAEGNRVERGTMIEMTTVHT